MSTKKPTKINQLLSTQPVGIVLQSSWLSSKGYSPDLQKRYRSGKWLESIGNGAMIRAGDQVSYGGALYALQNQTLLTVHPGGRTALSLLGKAHYLELATKKIVLFGNKGERLPAWFMNHNWQMEVEYYQSSFLPPDIGMVNFEFKNFSVKISGAIRAIMECLYLAPDKQELTECYEFMEGLNNFRPDQVQALLEKCQSIKVKRLFLYMAEMAGHDWFNHLNLKNVDLGHGKRSIVKNGVYVDSYQITVPKELKENGKRSL